MKFNEFNVGAALWILANRKEWCISVGGDGEMNILDLTKQEINELKEADIPFEEYVEEF